METAIAQRNKELANKLKHLDSSNDFDGNILANLLSKGDTDRTPQTIKKVIFNNFFYSLRFVSFNLISFRCQTLTDDKKKNKNNFHSKNLDKTCPIFNNEMKF